MKECERTAQGPVSKKNLLVLRGELTQLRQPALFHQDCDVTLLLEIILSLDNSVRSLRGYFFVSVRHSRVIVAEMEHLREQIRNDKLHLRDVEMYSHWKNALCRNTQTVITNVS